MSNILITGGGFVGSNLAIHLSKKHKVTVMDNLVRRGSEFNIPLFKERGIEFIHGDIRNKEDFPKHAYEFILETAAQPSACTGYSNPMFDITNNYLGLLNVLEYARGCGSNLIFWSTNKVYDADFVNHNELKEGKARWLEKCESEGISEQWKIDGGNHSIYGLSKVCADLTCQEWRSAFNMNIVVNRFSCLAGVNQFGKSEQGWVSWFCVAAILGLPVELYGWEGKQVRDVLFMPDLCSLIDIQMKNIHKASSVYNVGGGKFCNTSLLECIALIEEITDKKIKWSYNKNVRTADHCWYVSNIDKVKYELKWEPKIGMREGLTDIIDWVIKNEDKLRGLYA